MFEEIKLIADLEEVENLSYTGGCTVADIEWAESRLGMHFPREYSAYLLKYGSVSFPGVNWTGLGLGGYLNVIEATFDERVLNEYFPDKCFVLDGAGTFGKKVLVDSGGCVYLFYENEVRCLCNSIHRYLTMRMNGDIVL